MALQKCVTPKLDAYDFRHNNNLIQQKDLKIQNNKNICYKHVQENAKTYFNVPPTIRSDPWKNKTRHRSLSVHLETKYCNKKYLGYDKRVIHS